MVVDGHYSDVRPWAHKPMAYISHVPAILKPIGISHGFSGLVLFLLKHQEKQEIIKEIFKKICSGENIFLREIIPPSCATSPRWGIGRIKIIRVRLQVIHCHRNGGCPSGGGELPREHPK